MLAVCLQNSQLFIYKTVSCLFTKQSAVSLQNSQLIIYKTVSCPITKNVSCLFTNSRFMFRAISVPKPSASTPPASPRCLTPNPTPQTFVESLPLSVRIRLANTWHVFNLAQVVVNRCQDVRFAWSTSGRTRGTCWGPPTSCPRRPERVPRLARLADFLLGVKLAVTVVTPTTS
jgi:hypothetical protein